MIKNLQNNLNYRRFKKAQRRKKKIKRRKIIGLVYNYINLKSKIVLRDIIKVPTVFNYLENPLKCNYFFNQLRQRDNCNVVRGKYFFKICFQKTIDVDFAAISILKSIIEEATLSGISFSGNLPKDNICAKKIEQYGFLNNLKYNGNIDIKSYGEHLSYRKKSGKITIDDMKDFNNISEKAYLKITNRDGFFDELITVFKEIGSNAVEWSNSKGKQWMIGFYHDKDKIVINITDLGRGILESLHRGKRLQLIDYFFLRGSLQILERAFERKYGSLSQEVNRNKGLPFIKKTYEDNKVKNLIVSTNDIFYNFDRIDKCVTSQLESTSFSGTFYQWEIDKNCVQYYD